MKRIVLSIFFLVMLLVSCAKVEHHFSDFVKGLEEKVESSKNKVAIQMTDTASLHTQIEKTNAFEKQNQQLWDSIHSTVGQHPLYSTLKRDSLNSFGSYQPYLYWQKYYKAN